MKNRKSRRIEQFVERRSKDRDEHTLANRFSSPSCPASEQNVWKMRGNKHHSEYNTQRIKQILIVLFRTDRISHQPTTYFFLMHALLEEYLLEDEGEITVIVTRGPSQRCIAIIEIQYHSEDVQIGYK